MRFRTPLLAASAALAAPLAVSLALAAAHLPPPPPTPKRPVEDRYFGTVVRDDYRWLEDWNDPAVRAWSEAQNARTRAYLDALPMRPAVLARVAQLNRTLTPGYAALAPTRDGSVFALESRPPKQQPLLVRLASPQDAKSAKVIVDPNALDPSGATTIDFFVPSPDGGKVAVSLSKGGTEAGTVFVFDGRTGAKLADVVPRVNGGTAGGSLAWNAAGTGFWRTRYPAPGERPEADLPFFQQVYFHRLGTPADSDRYVLGRQFPKIAEIKLERAEGADWLLVDVSNGDGGEHAFWLGSPGGGFRQVTRFEDKVVLGRFGPGALYLLSRREAPLGRILKLPLEDADLARAYTLPAGPDEAIEWFVPTARRLYIESITGGPSRVRITDLEGRTEGELPLPAVSTVNALVKTTGDRVLFQRTGFTEPPRWLAYDPDRRRVEGTALVERSPARFDDVEVRRVFAVSKDGTKVPLTMLMKRGTKLDGRAPTLLYGYGSYGLSQRPGFSASRRVWIEQGGVYAIANIRGGGEYGEPWHQAGTFTRKQTGFDDFAACARWLVANHVTRPSRLACQGGSAGGILMGAMLTQHPDLFQAVVASVGVFDMLREELTPNGLFNITEFGTVTDSVQFAALNAFSPYQHVRSGVAYPAVLLTTGANDPRVDPRNSRKMCAALQAATTSARPVLLRTDAHAGHGVGSPLSARNALTADIDCFLFDQLGVRYAPPRTPALRRPAERGAAAGLKAPAGRR